ncbi:hypothetical protein VZT92_023820 [Zoarces viviparus]|uniref:Uncharacterized protein n=1 Tax=Zoarces viviparus TaxID=48416 RepID=A0AAW1E9R2_ZOAVI
MWDHKRVVCSLMVNGSNERSDGCQTCESPGGLELIPGCSSGSVPPSRCSRLLRRLCRLSAGCNRAQHVDD